MKSKRAKSQPPALQGQVQIYTGDGKGKTTAALGLALQGRRPRLPHVFRPVRGRSSGERAAARRLGSLITFTTFGRPGLIRTAGRPDPEDVRQARANETSAGRRCSGRYDIVVLDEINVALHFGLLGLPGRVLALLDEKPPSVELVLTGRRAPEALIRRAGLVTEMKEIKHYFQAGVPARHGIGD